MSFLLRNLLLSLILLPAAPMLLQGIVLKDAPDFSKQFEEAGVSGVLVVFDLDYDILWFHNQDLAEQRFAPASTFKIPNSLFGLQSGVVEGQDTSFKWDGRATWNAGWNQDQTFLTAFRHSAVWVYQEIARNIGKEQMQAFLRQAHYGNQRIGGPVDSFWLDGSLKISPMEQIDFLQKLYFKELPMSEDAQQTVKEMMYLEDGPGWILRGKTGWATYQKPHLGWFVGWLETERGVYFFANLLFMTSDSQAELRKTIVRDMLKGRGWMRFKRAYVGQAIKRFFSFLHAGKGGPVLYILKSKIF